jgi:hypothetical protein
MDDTAAILQLLEETVTYPGTDGFAFCGADQGVPEDDAGTVIVAVPAD